MKLNDNRLCGNFHQLNETSSEKGRTEVDGTRYKKSAHKDIVLSKGMLVNNETISKETENWDSLHKGSRRIIEENGKESFTQNPE